MSHKISQATFLNLTFELFSVENDKRNVSNIRVISIEVKE